MNIIPNQAAALATVNVGGTHQDLGHPINNHATAAILSY